MKLNKFELETIEFLQKRGYSKAVADKMVSSAARDGAYSYFSKEKNVTLTLATEGYEYSRYLDILGIENGKVHINIKPLYDEVDLGRQTESTIGIDLGDWQ